MVYSCQLQFKLFTCLYVTFSISLFDIYRTLFTALAKNSDNIRGTGGGAGTQLTPAETNALDSYDERDSNVITGVDNGYETAILVVSLSFQNLN